MTPFDASTAVQAHKNTEAVAAPAQLQRCERISEQALVGAIHDWLDGRAWSCDRAAYSPYHGYHIRLCERADDLVMLRKGDTLATAPAVLSRQPTRLHTGPVGTGATLHSEARALCAVVIRGDVGMYRS